MTEIPQLKDFMRAKGRAGNKKRGDEFEALIVSELQKLGFQVHLAVPSIKKYWDRKTGARGFVTKSADLWGCIDVVAFHPRADFTLFIQATTDREMLKRKQKDVSGTFTTYRPSRRLEIWTLDKGVPLMSELMVWRQTVSGWYMLRWNLYLEGLRLTLDNG